MSSWFRFWFLFSSFGPLYLIFAIKLLLNPGVGHSPPLIFFFFTLASALAFAKIRSVLASDNGTAFEITDIKPKDSEIFSYLTTYIPPLLARDMSDPTVYLPLAVLYSVLALAYFQLDSPYLNPFFILFGYRVYEGRIKDSRNLVTIIAKGRRLSGMEEATLYEVGTGDLYFCRSL